MLTNELERPSHEIQNRLDREHFEGVGGGAQQGLRMGL
jgi:hypothetical protein